MKNKKISKNELVEEVLELHRKLGRRPKKRDDGRLYGFSRKMFGSWNKLMEAAGYEVRYYQKVKLPKLDANLAYFLGLLITDGHVRVDKQKRYRIAVYTSYQEEKDMILKLISKLFNYRCGVSSRMWGLLKSQTMK